MGFWAKDVCSSSYFFGNTLVMSWKSNVLLWYKLIEMQTFFRRLGSKTFRSAAAWAWSQLSLRPLQNSSVSATTSKVQKSKSSAFPKRHIFFKVDGSSTWITGPAARSAVARVSGRGAQAQRASPSRTTSSGRPISRTTAQARTTVCTCVLFKIRLELCSRIKTVQTNTLLHVK